MPRAAYDTQDLQGLRKDYLRIKVLRHPDFSSATCLGWMSVTVGFLKRVSPVVTMYVLFFVIARLIACSVSGGSPKGSHIIAHER